jgi:hypothetical protein
MTKRQTTLLRPPHTGTYHKSAGVKAHQYEGSSTSIQKVSDLDPGLAQGGILGPQSYGPCREWILAKSIADIILRAHLDTLKYAAGHCISRNNYSINKEYHSLPAYYTFPRCSPDHQPSWLLA